jgi:hypothetical protein
MAPARSRVRRWALAASALAAAPAGAQSGAPAAVRVGAERVSCAAADAAPPPPFAVGEELAFHLSVGALRAGSARMRVEGVERVRDRDAYHVVFTLRGGVPLFRVRDRYDSWIDVRTLASLRHRQQIVEGRERRITNFEIFPDAAQYREGGDTLRPSVAHPLDGASLLYAVRAIGVQVGDTLRENRYFRPERNPVLLVGLRRETVTVPAGTFAATGVSPTSRTQGLFGEEGYARVWFSDDAARYPVLVKSRMANLPVTLSLYRITRGAPPSPAPAPDCAADAPRAP